MNYLDPSLIKTLVSMLRDDERLLSYLPYSRYIRECRTIGLILPRQTGKTKTLLDRHTRTSSKVFVFNQNIKRMIMADDRRLVDSVHSFSEMCRLGFISRDTGTGAKYECFLVDESDYMTDNYKEDFYQMIDRYKHSGLLSENFYVLKLTT